MIPVNLIGIHGPARINTTESVFSSRSKAPEDSRATRKTSTMTEDTYISKDASITSSRDLERINVSRDEGSREEKKCRCYHRKYKRGAETEGGGEE